MKIVLQRVRKASVTTDGKIVGSIDKGYLVLLGIGAGDDNVAIEKAVDKIQKLRLFADKDGKTNLSITDVGGELLVVSQFTLYADCRKGNRPSFTNAAPPDLAQELYEYFIEYASGKFAKVQHGVFGAAMDVALVNDGPFTVIIEKKGEAFMDSVAGSMKVRFSEAEVNIMQKALDQWGMNAQVGQAVEECAELIVALQKYVNRTPQPEMVDSILDEIADVEIMLAQMRLMLGIDDDSLRKRIESKFDRLRQYLLEK